MTHPGNARRRDRSPTVAAHPVRRLWCDIEEGLVFILHDPVLIKAIAYLTLAATTFLMVAALGPEFITSVIGLPKEDIGYIVAPGRARRPGRRAPRRPGAPRGFPRRGR